MSVFVDTSALYALMVRTERRHADVVDSFRRLLDEGRSFLTTSYVLIETIALLQHRIGLDPVRDLAESILPIMSVEWVGRDLHAGGLARLLRQDRRRLSLVDCVSIQLMGWRGIRTVLALDPHLAEEGRRVLPGG